MAIEWPTSPAALPSPTLFVFGGAYTRESMGYSALPARAEFERSYVVGLAYQQQHLDLGYGFLLGTEVGVAGRFGSNNSAEGWGGVSLRTPGLSIGGLASLSLGAVLGLSIVSDTHGIEREREQANNGSARLLGYIAPELALTFAAWPQVSLVYRLHHRSGANGTFGRMKEGHNAQVLGIRWAIAR